MTSPPVPIPVPTTKHTDDDDMNDDDDDEVNEADTSMMLAMGFSTFGSKYKRPQPKKQKLTQGGSVDVSTGGNQIPLGLRRGQRGSQRAEISSVPETARARDAMDEDVDEDEDEGGGGGGVRIENETGPTGRSEDAHQVLNNKNNNINTPTSQHQLQSQPQPQPHPQHHALPPRPLPPQSAGQNPYNHQGKWDWNALRRGIRDERGDLVIYDGSFVEDPWRGLVVPAVEGGREGGGGG